MSMNRQVRKTGGIVNVGLYDIVRFRFNEENEIIKEGVTLEEAQEHCNREDTHGDGWFDGYREVEDGN